MFSLVQGIYEELTYVNERKIALLGVESSGKSSILEWLKVYLKKNAPAEAIVEKPSSLEKMNPTVGLNVAKLHTAGEKLLVWDLGGAKALRSIWERYVEDAEVVIWVVDSADESKLEDSRDELKKLVVREHLVHSPLLIFANKQDQKDAIDPVKISLDLDLLSDAEKRPQCVQPCSAESGEGIREGIQWLMANLQGNMKLEIRIP
ncbi:Arfrp1 [Chondrus crispus]|uniref:Arfrp1 n=1 Tax=Chondrus crispus TaxID=2769 RepID=R7QT51_CHOCR|nr:Arfrp1 [Chondrus crispus]CDF40525.1 Arfrp1 [Chondrus crispus]|eukprot:XP_005710819.1 Arfrp1 [Chondrus crispus]